VRTSVKEAVVVQSGVSKVQPMQPDLDRWACKLLKTVARDGIEPPTPAFSGLLTDTAKWFRISAGCSWKESYASVVLGLLGMI